MALQGEEIRRRVLAAAALQGIGMRGVRDVLERFGANRTLAEAMIRGDQPQNDRNLRDLSEALGVPDDWFRQPDWRKMLVTRQPGAEADPIERELERAEVLGDMAELQVLLERVITTLRHDDQPPADRHNG